MYKLAVLAAILAVALAAPASEEVPAKTDAKVKRHFPYEYGLAPVNYGSSYYDAPLAYGAPLSYNAPLTYSAALSHNAPLSYSAPLSYGVPLTYTSPIKVSSSPLTYSSPLSYSAPAYAVSGYHGVSSPYYTIL